MKEKQSKEQTVRYTILPDTAPVVRPKMPVHTPELAQPKSKAKEISVRVTLEPVESEPIRLKNMNIQVEPSEPKAIETEIPVSKVRAC